MKFGRSASPARNAALPARPANTDRRLTMGISVAQAIRKLETGAVEVYVRPFPSLGGKWRVSNGGGMRPIWFRNGRELLYHNPVTGRAMVVSYSASGNVVSGDININ